MKTNDLSPSSPSSTSPSDTLPTAKAGAIPTVSPLGFAAEAPKGDAKALELQRAFAMFNQVSAELTQAYESLQARVASLTEQLAVANGELLRQFQEKEALSERLTLLLDALPAGVLQLDGEDRVAAINPAAQVLFGATIVGKRWEEVMRGVLKATATVGEWVLPRASGEAILAIAESVLPSGGKILLVHDMSAAHRMKAELERNKRLAAMGEMAASLAHQLRTPLAAALLYTSNLAQPTMNEASRAKFTDKATQQLRRLERLIQDVLLFARGESIGRDVIVVREWLNEVAQTIEPLAREHKIDFVLQDHSQGESLVGGKKSLFGALINLLENALQATPEGGQVVLGAEVAARQLQLSVRDSGTGIDKAMQSRIFEPFFTTKGQGTGLGLAIALGVIRAHHGQIDVLSDPEHAAGTEFRLTLPLPAVNHQ